MSVDYEPWEPDPQIEEVVNRKLAEVKQQLWDKFDNPDLIDGNPKTDHIIYSGDNDYSGTVMLRLDWELVVKENEDLLKEDNRENVVDLILSMISTDFCDLLENGDTDDRANPLLGVFNGKKKTGKELADITLGDIALYKEYKPSKNSVEYTIYTRLGPVWS